MTSLLQLETSTPFYWKWTDLAGGKSANILELNTIHQLNIMDIYVLLCPTPAEYTLLSSSHATSIKTDYTLAIKHTLTISKK